MDLLTYIELVMERYRLELELYCRLPSDAPEAARRRQRVRLRRAERALEEILAAL